jgi:hypothetical protein
VCVCERVCVVMKQDIQKKKVHILPSKYGVGCTLNSSAPEFGMDTTKIVEGLGFRF